MIVQLLTEHHLEFLSLKAGCRGSSKSTLVQMSNCWKSHAAAHITVCSAVITCVIVLTWFLFDQHHVINVIPHVIKVDPRCTSEV